jgi:uncharacterized phage protein gp47/JayE
MRVLAKALAGVFILLYKYAGFMFLQEFVSFASDKETVVNGKTLVPLVEWGRLIGVGDPVAATNAELLIDITVEVQTGALPTGSQLLNAANGVTYITLGAVLLNAPTVQATIRAVSDQVDGGGAGVIGNLGTGAVVSFANPLANVARDAVVATQTVTGADAESTDAYRQRVVDRFQKRPQGGALADYEIWGEEAAGIINIYPYTSDCPGQVDVFAEATVASSGSPDGIPTAAQLQAVLDLIELDENGIPTRRPANALVNTFAITRVPFDVRVTGLLVDNLAQVQTDITSAVEEYFLGREPFITGLTVSPRRDRVTRSAVGGVVDDIVSAAGGIFSSVIITQASINVELFALGIGEKAKADSVTFV